MIEHRIDKGDDSEATQGDESKISLALSELNMNFEVKDYSDSFMNFWPLVKKTAASLREEFSREGAELICDNWLREADEIYLPAVKANTLKSEKGAGAEMFKPRP